MDPDIVVRLEGVVRRSPDPRHVDLYAAAGGIDRARGLSRSVAGQAFRFVIRRRDLGVLVRVVAGDSVEAIAALRVTSAPIHHGRLETEPGGVVHLTGHGLDVGEPVASL